MARKHEVIRYKMARLHARLIVAAAFGIGMEISLAALSPWSIATQGLIAWNGGVVLYLALTFWMMAHANIAEIRRRACIQDEGAVALVVLTAVAASASLAAIVIEIGGAAGQSPPAFNIFVGMATIVLSWLFMHIIFALHYAHEYYGDGRDGHRGGLKFPGSAGPDYWDFVYYSFVIGMTSQVSDVQITSKPIRRLSSVHGVISFFFNVAVLALMVNMAAGLIKPGS